MRLQDIPPFAGYSDDEERPLGGYAILMALYSTLLGSFVAWFKGSGRSQPEDVGGTDILLLTAATHKTSRLLAKDRVVSTWRAPFTEYQEPSGHGEIEEKPRGSGLRKATGELVVCPNCLGLWVTTAFACGLAVAPRTTRTAACAMTALAGSDFLQLAFQAAKERAEPLEQRRADLPAQEG